MTNWDEDERWKAKFEGLLVEMEKMLMEQICEQPRNIRDGGRKRLGQDVNGVRKVWDALKLGWRVCLNPKCCEPAHRLYCSERCANAARQQRFREKHRKPDSPEYKDFISRVGNKFIELEDRYKDYAS